MQIGIISDTHSLVRPEAIGVLNGSELILHAGDIGKPDVLQALGEIAPVIAVRGNVDRGEWAATIPDCLTIKIEQVSIHIIHIIQELAIDPQANGIQVVISGHTHKPSLYEKAGVLYLNPGSAGPRRFKLPIAVAQLHIEGDRVQAKMIELSL